MPRARRPISAEGYLRCTRCGETKHIRDFYQNKGDSVWFIEDTDDGCIIHGKPNSWCKTCMKESQSSRNKERYGVVKELRAQEDAEWEKAVEQAYQEGIVLIKDPITGEPRGIPKEDWER